MKRMAALIDVNDKICASGASATQLSLSKG